MSGDGEVNECLSIDLGCLLPIAFDLTLTCGTKCRDVTEAGQVEKSVRRQLDAACEKWKQETCGKIQVNYELLVTSCRVRRIKKYRVKEPSVAMLLGAELYGKASCFMVWVPLPDCDFEVLGIHPYTKDEYMWIPTTEKRALDDLERCKPRDAASHELKHWVKNLWVQVAKKANGQCPLPSPHKDGYWDRLKQALTPENIANLDKEIVERKRSRGGSAAPPDEPGAA